MKKNKHILNKMKKDFKKFQQKTLELPQELLNEIESGVGNTLWEAYANKNCKYCYGVGKVSYIPIGNTLRKKPCSCSIVRKYKAIKKLEENSKDNLVAIVTNQGKKTRLEITSFKDLCNNSRARAKLAK